MLISGDGAGFLALNLKTDLVLAELPTSTISDEKVSGGCMSANLTLLLVFHIFNFWRSHSTLRWSSSFSLLTACSSARSCLAAFRSSSWKAISCSISLWSCNMLDNSRNSDDTRPGVAENISSISCSASLDSNSSALFSWRWKSSLMR